MGTQLTSLPGSSAFSLPGAWPSTDSLEETLRLPNVNPPDEEPLCIVPDASRSGAIESRTFSNAAGERSLRNSVATYDDDSDDFYSFIEDDDVEGASSPNPRDFLAVPIKVEIGGSIISENPGTTPTPSNPGLGHTEDTTTSDDTSPSQKVFVALETSVSIMPSSDGSNCTPPLAYNHSRPTFLTPGPTPRTSLVTSSSRSINSESSSSGSARLGDEEFSYHLGHSEDESTVSHTQLYGAIDEGHFSNTSEESLSVHILPSSPPARRSRIQRRVIENHDSPLDILHLAQPDGHNPWTLSLEPALVDLSELSTASRTCISVESSSMAHSPSASPESRLQTPVPPQTPTAPQSFAVAQSEPRTSVGLGRPSVDLLPPHYPAPSSYSTFSIPHPTEKKDIVQKPKTFYQKMKRFFTPKSSRRNESRGISNDVSVTTPVNASLALLPSYANKSSSQWSLNRRTFKSSARSSAPSIALSCTPDIPYNSTYHSSPGVAQETRHTFEYRRPSTSEGTKPPSKRNRRFSVPTPFYASSLVPSPPSSSRNISIPSSRLFGKRGPRVGESDH